MGLCTALHVFSFPFAMLPLAAENRFDIHLREKTNDLQGNATKNSPAILQTPLVYSLFHIQVFPPIK